MTEPDTKAPEEDGTKKDRLKADAQIRAAVANRSFMTALQMTAGPFRVIHDPDDDEDDETAE